MTSGRDRRRARDAGIIIGHYTPGPLNAITDVGGVRVGHCTLIEGERTRTGATAILPHGGDVLADKVPAGFAVLNGYGKFAGSTQIVELGELETPIVLTNTLAVGRAMEALVRWTLERSGQAGILSINAVVGETNDGRLNDIRASRPSVDEIRAALAVACGGPVEEGAVGAGTGTIAFGRKGGIGTSSRLLPPESGGFTVGVLVQANYGGRLRVDGREIAAAPADTDGSIVILVATDAPLSSRNLTRLATRAFGGLARTGAALSNGSGDYALAFSTAEAVRRTPERRAAVHAYPDWPNEAMSPLFEATIEAAEEAILNALLMAVPMDGWDALHDRPNRVGALRL